MIRGLVIIAVAGFLMSVACISGAIALGGAQILAHGPWVWRWDWEGGEDHVGGWRPTRVESRPQIDRVVVWRVPAQVALPPDQAGVNFSATPSLQ